VSLDFNKILDRIDYWQDKGNKWDIAFKQLSEAIAPSCYPLVIDSDFAEAFVDGLSEVHPELKGDLMYYLYEVPNVKGHVNIVYKGKTYNVKKRDRFIKYLELLVEENG